MREDRGAIGACRLDQLPAVNSCAMMQKVLPCENGVKLRCPLCAKMLSLQSIAHHPVSKRIAPEPSLRIRYDIQLFVFSRLSHLGFGDWLCELGEGDVCPFFHAPMLNRGGMRPS